MHFSRWDPVFPFRESPSAWFDICLIRVFVNLFVCRMTFFGIWASDAANGRDATVYGLYETPGAFFAHHAAALSVAVVRREATAIEAGTEKREFRRMHPGLFMAGPAHL